MEKVYRDMHICDASRTHFSPTSFATTQSLEDILAAYREIGHPTPPPQGKSE